LSKISIKQIRNIGIIGGGKLGQMSCEAAQNLGFRVVIYSDVAECPGALVADELIVGDYSDGNKLKEFVGKVDVVACEFENIPYETAKIINETVNICPNPEILKIAQNRVFEKNFINGCGVKTADFKVIESKEGLVAGLQEFKKAVLKTATLGYDGKGQYVLTQGDSMDDVWNNVSGLELVLEKFCPFDSEISILVARKESGETSVFEPTRNIHKDGILDESHYPSGVGADIVERAKDIAIKLSKGFDLVGLLCVEFFVLSTGELLVNEVAPRPHNSGHFTMSGANVSQYEQLVRAISHLNLGDVSYTSAGYMKNLVGDDISDLSIYEQDKNATIHLYGKTEARSGRKMGHVNILEE